MKVKCDICDVEFEIDNSKMKVKNVNDIEVNYFECHKCNHKYITSCYDNYVLREQNKLKKLDEKISATTNGKEIDPLVLEDKNYYINYIIRKNDLTLKYDYFKKIKQNKTDNGV